MTPAAPAVHARRALAALVVAVVVLLALVAWRTGVGGALLAFGVAALVAGTPAAALLARERRRALARAAARPPARPRHCDCCGPEGLHRLDAVDTAVDAPTVVHG